jgi:hypothetical protein
MVVRSTFRCSWNTTLICIEKNGLGSLGFDFDWCASLPRSDCVTKPRVATPRGYPGQRIDRRFATPFRVVANQLGRRNPVRVVNLRKPVPGSRATRQPWALLRNRLAVRIHKHLRLSHPKANSTHQCRSHLQAVPLFGILIPEFGNRHRSLVSNLR